MGTSTLAVSVVLVSDYGAGDSKGWDDLRATLSALARQDYTGRAEFILSENEEFAGSIPADVLALLPSLRVLCSPNRSSYALKNHGVAEATADIVVILDADCRPDRDYLTRLTAAFEAHPDADVVSGHTNYEGGGTGERVLALLCRSYVDPGPKGVTPFISNNNAGWKRSVYLAHPLPTGLGAFAARIQSESVRRTGGVMRFDPSVRAIHEFEGWRMEKDIRRNTGFGTVITRLRDPRLPYAWLIRRGWPSIPFIVAGKTWNSWRDCLRCWRRYGVRWYELPLAVLAAPVLIAMETPGMWAAYADREVSETAYR
jgi:glycosyltransferase involved in cell wall biosynthesis